MCCTVVSLYDLSERTRIFHVPYAETPKNEETPFSVTMSTDMRISVTQTTLNVLNLLRKESVLQENG